METCIPLGQLVRISDGRIGVVVSNEVSGGIFRDHCGVWFGCFNEKIEPKVEHLHVKDDWELIQTPIAIVDPA